MCSSSTRGGITITLLGRKTQLGKEAAQRCACHSSRRRRRFQRSFDIVCCSCRPQVVARDSFFHLFGEGGAGGAGVRVSVGEEGEEAGAVMDEDGQVESLMAIVLFFGGGGLRLVHLWWQS